MIALRFPFFTTIIWIFFLIPLTVNAHPGGLDDNGGHRDKTTGEYHCHRTDCISPPSPTPKDNLDIVSFNIQFLGHFKDRDNTALANVLRPFDIVVVQELVAPPYRGQYPDGTSYKADKEAELFFNVMSANGFSYILSEEDTGTNDVIHKNSAATEWWVSFYKADKVTPANDLPHGFLADDRSNNVDYERVPYATAFRTRNKGNDFVLISVHLQPGDRDADTKRRKHELTSIATWIDVNDEKEKDFFVIGDMNFENCDEISLILPANYHVLNSGENCLTTNTNIRGPRPYDNVLLPPSSVNGLSNGGSFRVINLIEAMRSEWFQDFTTPYPGDKPYNHNAFRTRYSDHHPIHFRLLINVDDD